VQPGDVLLAQILVYDGTATNVPTAPAGWAPIRHDSISNGNQMTSWLYYKIAGASEPGSYGWNIAPQYAAGLMGAWRNTTASPLDMSSGAFSAGTGPIAMTAPALVPTNDMELQIYFYGAQSFIAPVIGQPSQIIQRTTDRSSIEGFTLGIGELAAPSHGNLSLTYTGSANTSIPGGSLVGTSQAVLLIPNLP